MSHVLIVGAGGVGAVCAHKCAQRPEVFSEITLASRRLGSCEKVAREVHEKQGREIRIAQLDADDRAQTVSFLRERKPDMLLNMALPYQDLPLMDACLEAGVDYLDTANYEPPETAHFEYSHQWAYQDRFKEAGRCALLGAGFDPGTVNVYVAYAAKHYFDELHELDIIDCNAGDHGQPFATNFNPEINIREITADCRHWEQGQWQRTPAMSRSQVVDFPAGIGPRKVYRMYHEELESLARFFPTLRRAQFWMTFSDNYLKHLEVLQNVGLTRIEPIEFQGQKIIPLQFLKALLPDPSSLGPLTRGKTCIGTLIQGIKDGQPRSLFIYNVCQHEEAYADTLSQAVSYTAGVPPVAAAELMLRRTWHQPGVWNMEQFDPDPFMEIIGGYGLPWEVMENGPAITEAVS